MYVGGKGKAANLKSTISSLYKHNINVHRKWSSLKPKMLKRSRTVWSKGHSIKKGTLNANQRFLLNKLTIPIHWKGFWGACHRKNPEEAVSVWLAVKKDGGKRGNEAVVWGKG